MKVLLLYKGVDQIGGIETLLIRLVAFFSKSGHEAIVMLRDDSLVRDQLQGAHVYQVRNYFNDLMLPRRLHQILNDYEIKEVHGVLAVDHFSAMIAPLIARYYRVSDCTAVASNWVPDYFRLIREKPWHPMALFMRWNLKYNFNKETTLMMKGMYITDGKKLLGDKWGAKVFPVPIQGSRFLAVHRLPIRGKIISVGRLDEMKEYNLHMPKVIAELRAKGYDVTWDVYGVGIYESRMRALVDDLNLNAYIQFKGSIEYKNLPPVFETAQCFVGMGTALLEASLAGVPNVHAAPFDENGASEGPVYCTTLGDFERESPPNLYTTIRVELERLLNLTPEEYERESEKVKQCAMASEESLVMCRLFDALESPPTFVSGFALYQFLLSCYIYTRRVATRLLRNRAG